MCLVRYLTSSIFVHQKMVQFRLLILLFILSLSSYSYADNREEQSCKEKAFSFSVNASQTQPANDVDSGSYSRQQGSMVCTFYGGGHLKTVNNRHESCSALGWFTMVDHPLFYVLVRVDQLQSKSSVNHEFFALFHYSFTERRLNATGITAAMIVVNQFDACSLKKSMVYFTDIRTRREFDRCKVK